MDITLEKVLPNNLEVERFVLGFTLASGRLEADLEADNFYLEANRRIWRAIKDLVEEGVGPDLITVKDKLRQKNELDACGGAAYLANLTDWFPSYNEALAQQYIDILREQRALRVGVKIGSELMGRCYEAQEKFTEIVSDTFSGIDEELGRINRKSGLTHISELVTETFKTIEEISDRKETGGFHTGYADFDRIVHRGFQKKELDIIAGRPGSGKTSLLMGMCRRMGGKGVPQAVFSLEMAAPQLIMRMIAEFGRVPLARMNTGYLNKEDWNKISRAAGELSQMPIWIDDSSSLMVSDIRSRVRRLRSPISIILIDYLQLVAPPKHLISRNDVEKISNISMSLKGMAKSMDVAVVAAAQLNRGTENRKDSSPKISDLRQSGQIEQDADLIVLLHRHAENNNEESQGIAEVIIGKQRNGATGSFQMNYVGEYTSFDDLYQEPNSSPERWYDR
jgi:replicative DNA helicase